MVSAIFLLLFLHRQKIIPNFASEISIKLNNYEKDYLLSPPRITATDGKCTDAC